MSQRSPPSPRTTRDRIGGPDQLDAFRRQASLVEGLRRCSPAQGWKDTPPPNAPLVCARRRPDSDQPARQRRSYCRQRPRCRPEPDRPCRHFTPPAGWWRRGRRSPLPAPARRSLPSRQRRGPIDQHRWLEPALPRRRLHGGVWHSPQSRAIRVPTRSLSCPSG